MHKTLQLARKTISKLALHLGSEIELVRKNPMHEDYTDMPRHRFPPCVVGAKVGYDVGIEKPEFTRPVRPAPT